MYKLKAVTYISNINKIFSFWYYLFNHINNGHVVSLPLYLILLDSFNFTYIVFLRIKRVFQTKALVFERFKFSKYFFDQQNWMKLFFSSTKNSQLCSEIVMIINDDFIKHDLNFYYDLLIESQKLNIVFKKSKKFKDRLWDISFYLRFLVYNNFLFSSHYILFFFNFLKKIEKIEYLIILILVFITQLFFLFFFFLLYKFIFIFKIKDK